ncbi:uncharacterized protein P174DRAFT_435807 [Aspergillus novofumigatus IBT 16806]|uniref:Uncharacterized protein n=1 Tax=Aspergillus novofumigatus (strain IBT 16806) TaxID=1392255 RepID=A0A2I1BUQ3_ASPN1|nr:uncharacterized protein P174DRAFT_435807 [Aspergillus novofumigatus IBT 16806]PKX89118.1 hypothetical protein P174DRAFT_435807 [Aspergillus novofumigatus IBT 16806]
MIYLKGALCKQFTAFFNLNHKDSLTTIELQALAGRAYKSDDKPITKEESNEQEVFKDIKNIIEFDSNKELITVTFSHTSLGDFFRNINEGKVSAVKDRLPTRVIYNDAKAHVLKICLKVLTNTEFSEKPKDPSVMLNYATSN